MNELVDFHTHILPALDHGSKNIEETANQIALLMEGNIDEVVCTSHFYGHVHNIHDFLERRSESASLLETYISENNIDFRFHLRRYGYFVNK